MGTRQEFNSDTAMPPGKTIIKGVTQDGRTFRPSDWAQRLTTAVSTPGPDRRVRFHPKVHMANLEGVSCVVVDGELRDEDPNLYEFLVNFGRNNNLQIEENVRTSST